MNTEKNLYQWDTGQKLAGCTGLYVDFLIDNEVYRVETADGMCIIPDELLQTSGSHKVYECMTDNTIRSFAFSVAPRPKPPDYVYTPTERLTFEGLVQKVDDAIAEFDTHTEQIQTDISELQSDIVNKIDAPKNPTVGKILKIKSVNEDGTFVCEWADGGSGVINDVRMDGESIVQDGVVNIPYATATYPYKSGVIVFSTARGLNINTFADGSTALSLNQAKDSAIDERNPLHNSGYGAITSGNFDYAVKAAMCDGKGDMWTDDEKTAGRARMGAVSADEVSAMINKSLGVIENGSY